MMYLKSRSSWLKHNQQLSPIGRSGRKRFDIHKNRQTTNMDADTMSYTRTPKKYIHFTPISQRADLSAEASAKRLPKNEKLNPIDSLYYKKKLREKDSEILVLKSMYKDTAQQLFQYQKSSRFNAKPILYAGPVDVPRKDFTPEPRAFNDFDLFKQKIFMQPKFTKSNPKIVLSNPITGISPNLV